jgi:hypothetical protein
MGTSLKAKAKILKNGKKYTTVTCDHKQLHDFIKYTNFQDWHIMSVKTDMEVNFGRFCQFSFFTKPTGNSRLPQGNMPDHTFTPLYPSS